VKKSKWSDNQLEEVLRQMPKIKDHRDPQDIYQSLSSKIKKQKRQSWIIPGFATAAAMLLLFILAPNLVSFQQESADKAVEEKADSGEMRILMEDSGSSGSEVESKSKSNEDSNNKMSLMVADAKTAVYEEEVGNRQVLTYWIPDPQVQFLVPISIIADKEKGLVWMDLFNKQMERLTEEEWGLSEYYPLKGRLSLGKDENTAVFDAEIDHLYGDGAASETSFINTIQRNMQSNSLITRVEFTTNKQPGIMFGNHGNMTGIEINLPLNRAYFSYVPEGQDQLLLVPSVDTFNEIGSALEAMKHDVEILGLKSSIPEDLLITSEVEEKTLVVTFENPSVLTDDEKTLHILESILLTAKDFGMETVSFENLPLKEIGGMDLSKEVKVPIAANERNL
jgi:hypothetical protein